MRSIIRVPLAWLTLPILAAFLLVGVQPVEAALKINPPGSWEVVGTGASGAVGDIVTIEFAITFVTDSYADTDFEIQTVDEAREKVSFVGVAPPAGSPTVTAEEIDWPETEFEAGVTKKYRIQVRIDRGAVGDEITGFYVHTYTGKSIMYGVADDVTIKIVAKSSPKPTAVPKATPAKATAERAPSPTKQPVAVTAPMPKTNSLPISANRERDVTPARDKVRNDASPVEDTPNITTPAPLATIQPQIAAPSIQQSFFGRMTASVRAGFRAIGTWLNGLF